MANRGGDVIVALPLVIIGAGSIGLRHIEVAAASPLIDLLAVVEPVSPSRPSLQQTGLPVVATLDDVPRGARAAIVATPTATHAQIAATCIERGLAVLVEKPIAHSIGHARRLISLAEGKGIPLFVGHHRRCHPFSIKARDLIAELGTTVGVQGLWSLRKHDSYFDTPWRTQPGAGLIMTNFSHEVDLLQFLLGEITEVTALTSSNARGLVVEDCTSISFRFKSGALGSFLMSDAGLSPWAFETGSAENPALATSGEDYLRIIGTQGAMAFPSLTRWDNLGAPGDWTMPLTRHLYAADDRIDPLLEQVNRFANVVSGAQDNALCTGEAGLRALAVTLAALYSAQRGRPVCPDHVPEDFDETEEGIQT